MGMKIVCNVCNHISYEGIEIIPLYKLRQGINNKCPNCNRKRAIRPISVKLFEIKGAIKNGEQISQITKTNSF